MHQKLGFHCVGKHKFDVFGFEDDFILNKDFFEKIHDFLPEVRLFEL